MNTKTNVSSTTRRITFCALFAALAIVLTRLLSYAPIPDTRYSLGDIPIFLAGMFFGPLAGGLVGFGSDLIGAVLFSPHGYNPMLCLPAILYGVIGGLFCKALRKHFSLPLLALSFLIPAAVGSVLIQSAVMAKLFFEGSFMAGYIGYLTTRGIQYVIVSVVDIALIYLLARSRIFTKVGIWYPEKG